MSAAAIAPAPPPVADPGILRLLEGIADPEIPAVSIVDLGIVREIAVEGGRLTVTLTPTYSACPAIDLIVATVVDTMRRAGHDADVRLRLAPAWSTDWITPGGRARLEAYGIAPPGAAAVPEASPLRFHPRRVAQHAPACPRCKSEDTEQLSAFGSTACKSLWRCRACREPFDYFKPL